MEDRKERIYFEAVFISVFLDKSFLEKEMEFVSIYSQKGFQLI